MPSSDRITLMAAGELREALTAYQRGDVPGTVGALMAIDPGSWEAINRRLNDIGGSIPGLLADLSTDV